nr:MAG TPA: hypothetical protein [Caudoviricetes sp.]
MCGLGFGRMTNTIPPIFRQSAEFVCQIVELLA